MLDGFVNNYLFVHIRSSITVEINDPASSYRAHPLVRHLPDFLFVQAQKRIDVQTQNLITFNKDITKRNVLRYGSRFEDYDPRPFFTIYENMA